jgi:hypothetical protein
MRSPIQIGLLVLTSVLVLGCSERIRTQDDVRKMLSEHLPPGTSEKQVGEYLDKQQIPHSECAQPAENCVLAKFSGGTQRFNVVRTDYGVTFRFDARNTLVATEIKPYYTGP